MRTRARILPAHDRRLGSFPRCCGVPALLLSAMAGSAMAQVRGSQAPTDAFLKQQRVLEEEVRSALDTEMPVDQKIAFDVGGWYSFYTFLWDDGINSSRTYRQHDARVWGSAS